MRSFYIGILILFVFSQGFAQPKVDSVLVELERVLDQKDDLYSQKYDAINGLREKLKATAGDDKARFDIYQKLFWEYGSFIYDSAFSYASRMQHLSFSMGNPEMIMLSRMRMSFVLLSSGMFHEALDTLQMINPDDLGVKMKVEYFDLIGRAYYDMAEYASDPYFAPLYNSKGNASTRNAIQYADPGNYQKWASIALLNLKSNRIDSALFYYQKVVGEFDLSLHQNAMIYASMADCSFRNGDTLDAVSFLANSAINDIKSVVTETIALRYLANVLFYLGYIKEAHTYIVLANNNARFYGARQRAFQISGVLPIIEGEKMELIESQKKQLEIYIILLAILSAVIIFSLVVIFKQLTRLKKARVAILEANENLKLLNEHLGEANKIKEEYIAYYFNISTNYVDKLEYLKESILRNIENKRYGNINQALGKLVIKKEREQLFQNFDKIFLNIFPDFVDDFNALFDPADRVELNDQGAMNTDLRIFALIRMGIFENEKIAKILNFSINTIYSYKNRIKKRSNVPNNEFEERIMEIKSV